MFPLTGVPSLEMVRQVFPSLDRINKGPVAVIECFEKIPCNPCSMACKIGAISPFKDINDRPHIDHDLCTGCSLCISSCPGLAIMVVDGSKYDDSLVFKLPYEMLPLPKVGDQVMGLDRRGRDLELVEVVGLDNRQYQDKTLLVHLKVPRKYLYEFRNFKVV